MKDTIPHSKLSHRKILQYLVEYRSQYYTYFTRTINWLYASISYALLARVLLMLELNIKI